MTIRKASFPEVAVALALVAGLVATRAAPAMPLPMPPAIQSAIVGEAPVAVRWRGRARGAFEQALIARAIANGVVPDPGPLYGRYLGYHGYPGHYRCCYEPQSFERFTNPYYTLSRAGAPNPTWWDYPVHWEGW